MGKKATVPVYVLRGWHRIFSRITSNARCSPQDLRTLNALRLAGKALRRMETLMEGGGTE